MMRSLFSGVSGLKNHQTAMDVIGHNVANVNTTGYKANRTIFSDIVSQTISEATAPTIVSGGMNSKQVGLGVQISAISKDMTEGSTQNTEAPLDFAIHGEGYFAVLAFDGTIKFTRNGNFAVDRDGFLVTQSGEYVLGKLGTQDEIAIIPQESLIPNPDLENFGFDKIHILGDIGVVHMQDGEGNRVYYDRYGNKIIPTLDEFGNATQYTYIENPVDDDGNPLLGGNQTSMVAGDVVRDTELVYQDIYGNKIAIDLNGSATQPYSYVYLDAAPVDGDGNVIDNVDPGVTTVQDTETLYREDIYGNLIMTDPDLGELVYVYDPVDADGNPLYIQDPNDATNTIQILAGNTVDTFVGGTPVPPLADTGAYTDSYTNNYAAGADAAEPEPHTDDEYFLDYAIDNFGQVTCTNEDGDLIEIGRLLLVTFNNAAGLDALGDSKFTTSANSGEAVYNFVGVECGTIQSGQLEMSNVNLATELTNMIIIQRGFQANSRIITTSDTMLEELVNLKR